MVVKTKGKELGMDVEKSDIYIKKLIAEYYLSLMFYMVLLLTLEAEKRLFNFSVKSDAYDDVVGGRIGIILFVLCEKNYSLKTIVMIIYFNKVEDCEITSNNV